MLAELLTTNSSVNIGTVKSGYGGVSNSVHTFVFQGYCEMHPSTVGVLRE